MKRLKENLIFSNKFVKFFNDDVLFNDKTKGTHIRIFAEPMDRQIAILAFDSDLNIIIQDEFRYSFGGYLTQCSMGGVKNDQTFLDAAKMELEEELSLFTGNKDIISLGNFLTEPGLMCSRKEAFLAFNCKEKNNSIPQEDTEMFTNRRKIPFFKILDDVNSGKIQCATTQMIILRASFIIRDMLA